MSDKPRLYSIEPETKTAKAVGEVDFATLGLRERQDIQEWVAAHPDILDDNLLIITKEFSGFDLTSERADLVAVDKEGSVVVIELKRDDTGSDAHWQAIKYASYFSGASAEDIARLLSDHAGVEPAKAKALLAGHLEVEADDLGDLNRRQRIILASHRFAPEVTSAVLWLNGQAATDMITCVQLTPYRDQDTGSLSLQATTLLPISDHEDLQVKDTLNNPSARLNVLCVELQGHGLIQTILNIGSSPGSHGTRGRRGRNDDEITGFLRLVGEIAMAKLDDNLKPDKRSRSAGLGGMWGEHKRHRYYHLWYSTPPWSNHGMSFQIRLFPADESKRIKAIVGFMTKLDSKKEQDVKERMAHLKENTEWDVGGDYTKLGITVSGEALAGGFQDDIATSLVTLIEAVRPEVDDLIEIWNEA